MKDQSDTRMPLRLTAPRNPQGYASPDSKIGRFYADAVNSAANEFQQFLPNAVTRSPDIEVSSVNEGFARMRAYIANRMMQYIMEHDGVVEAWPDPAAGLTFRFVSEDGEPDSAESYHFNYFAKKIYQRFLRCKQSFWAAISQQRKLRRYGVRKSFQRGNVGGEASIQAKQPC